MSLILTSPPLGEWGMGSSDRRGLAWFLITSILAPPPNFPLLGGGDSNLPISPAGGRRQQPPNFPLLGGGDSNLPISHCWGEEKLLSQPNSYTLPTCHAASCQTASAPCGAGFQPTCRLPLHCRQGLAVVADAQARTWCNNTSTRRCRMHA